MHKTFTFKHLKKDAEDSWEIYVKWHEVYRDYVLMKKIRVQPSKRIPIIMLNPGRFLNEKGQIYSDTSLRNIRYAFMETNYEIEVLNLFNLCDSNSVRFVNRKELKDYRNPLLEWLKDTKSHIVLTQWGNLCKFDKWVGDKEKEVLDCINQQKLKRIFLSNKDGSCSHPVRWKKDIIAKFQKTILPQINNNQQNF